MPLALSAVSPTSVSTGSSSFVATAIGTGFNASSVMLAQKDAAPRMSARNKIPGTVVLRTDDGADSEVTIDIGGGKTITAVVTREGADEAGATMGAQVLAIFKTSHVILASD